MFKLSWPAYPNPAWFSSRSEATISGVVLMGNQVKTENDILDLMEGQMPEVGEIVVVEKSKYFLTGKNLSEVEKEKKEKELLIEKKKFEDEEKRKNLQKKIRNEAFQKNEKLHVPVEWTSGFKSVLSGLSEKSWGNGINKKSVVHILLKEDIMDGKFVRKSGSFLCTTKGGTNGMEYVDLERLSHDDEGSYISEVTCKACIKTALRFSK